MQLISFKYQLCEMFETSITSLLFSYAFSTQFNEINFAGASETGRAS